MSPRRQAHDLKQPGEGQLVAAVAASLAVVVAGAATDTQVLFRVLQWPHREATAAAVVGQSAVAESAAAGRFEGSKRSRGPGDTE